MKKNIQKTLILVVFTCLVGLNVSGQISLTSITAYAPEYAGVYGDGTLVTTCDKEITFTLKNTGSSSITVDVELNIYNNDNYINKVFYDFDITFSPNQSKQFTSSTSIVGGGSNGLGGNTGNGPGSSYSLKAKWKLPSNTIFNFVGSPKSIQILANTDNCNSGGSCTYSINPTSKSFTSSAGTGNINVTAGTGCAWTATKSANWITITSGNSGTGNGTCSYSVSANTGSARNGTITIEGETFYITQDGPSGSAPVASFSPLSVSISEGGTVNFTDLSSGSPTSWLWSFPGGSPANSSSANPNVSYSTAGTYNVTLTVTNSYGSDSQTGTVTVTQNCTNISGLRTCDNKSLYPSAQSCTPNLRFSNAFNINGSTISGNGQIYLNNYNGNTLSLYNGSYNLFVSGASFQTPATMILNQFTDFAGVNLKLTEIAVQCDGINAKGNFGLPKFKIGGGTSFSANFTDLYFTTGGLNFAGSFNATNIGIPNVFRLNSLDVTYNTYNKDLVGDAELETKLLTIGAGIGIKGGKFDRIAFSIAGNNVGIPLGTTGLQLTSGYGEVKNLTNAQNLEVFLGVGMAPVGLDAVSEIDVDGKFLLGKSYEATGTLKLLSNPVAHLGFKVEPTKINFNASFNIITIVKGWSEFNIIKYNNNIKLSAVIGANICYPDPEEIDANAVVVNSLRVFMYSINKNPGDIIAEGNCYLANKLNTPPVKAVLAGYVGVHIPLLCDRLYFQLGWKGGFNFSKKFGTNYNWMYTEAQQALGLFKSNISHQIFTVNNFEENIIIEAFKNNGIPEIAILFPNGDTLNNINYNNYDVNYMVSSNDGFAAYSIKNPYFGDYKVKLINADSIHVFGAVPPPFIKLTGITNNTMSKTLTIDWEDSSPADDAVISIGYSPKKDVINGSLIAENILVNDGVNSYIWDYQNAESGEYYIYALIQNSKGMFSTVFSENKYKIINSNSPDSPSNCSVSSNGSSVLLSWTQNNNAGINYLIYYSDKPGEINFSSMNYGVGDTNTYELNTLIPGRYYEFMVTAIDSNWNESDASNVVSLEYESSVVNNPPYIPKQNLPHKVYIGQSVSYSLIAYDKDNDPLTYIVTEGPTGMTINSAGQINWTPSASQIGLNFICIVVSDPSNTKDSVMFEIAVFDDFNATAWLGFNKPIFQSYSDFASITLHNFDYDTDDEIKDTVSVRIFSNSDMTGITVNAIETSPKSRIFITDFKFTPTASIANSVMANYGDTIWAEYHDLSPNIMVREYAYFVEFKSDFTHSDVVCAGDTIFFTNRSSGSGMSYLWDFGDGQTDTIRNPYHIFNPQPGVGAVNYTVSLNISDDEGLTSLKTILVAVYRKPLVDIGDNIISCGNAVLDAQNIGSIYEWNTGEVSSAITVIADGIYSVIVENENGCINSDSVNVLIHPLPQPSFSLQPHICTNDAPIALIGNYNNQGTFMGDGVSSSHFDPTGLSIGMHDIAYTYTNEFGCSDTVFNAIEVKPLPILSFIAGDYELCLNEMINLSANPAGGIYSGTGVLNGTFSSLIAGAGNHTVNYEYTDVFGCTNNVDQNISVHLLPTISIAGLAPSYCADFQENILVGSPAGGAFSGVGIYDSIFNPSVSGVGLHDITYTYTDSLINCSNSLTVHTTVFPLPTVNLTTPLTSICNSSNPVQMSGTPTGGVYSGDGITNSNTGIFDPAAGQMGLNSVSYAVSNIHGCTNTAATEITVVEMPHPGITGDSEICAGDTTTLTVSAGDNYLWSDNSTNGFIIVHPIQTTQYSVTVTNGNICSAGANYQVNVHQLPSQPLITNQGMLLSTNATANTYQWYFNGAEIPFANINIYLAEEFGMYQVRIWDENFCSNISEPFYLGPADVPEILTTPNYIIYPNPTKNIIYVELNENMDSDIEIEILSVLGEIIYNKKMVVSADNKIISISLTDQSNGIYIMRIKSGDEQATERVVLTR